VIHNVTRRVVDTTSLPDLRLQLNLESACLGDADDFTDETLVNRAENFNGQRAEQIR